MLKLCLLILLVSILFPISKGGFSISPIEEDVADYKWNLSLWEATHLWGKWIYKAKAALTSDKSNAQSDGFLSSFFDISHKIYTLEKIPEQARVVHQTSSIGSLFGLRTVK